MGKIGLNFIGYLGSGQEVYDRKASHLHKEMDGILEEALATIDTSERFTVQEVEFNRVVGYSNCVKTDGNDRIVYAVRKNRNGYTRFALNRKPEASTKAVIILKKDDDEDYYILITAFVGSLAAREPWDPCADKNDLEFWLHHALVWDPEEIIDGTQTTEYPW